MDVIAVKLDMLMNLNVVIVTPLAMPLMPSIGPQLVNANVSFDRYIAWCSGSIDNIKFCSETQTL